MSNLDFTIKSGKHSPYCSVPVMDEGSDSSEFSQNSGLLVESTCGAVLVHQGSKQTALN